MKFKVGDVCVFTRPTFLLNGVLVLQNSQVEIKEIQNDLFTAIYIDREGFTHELSDILESELEAKPS